METNTRKFKLLKIDVVGILPNLWKAEEWMPHLKIHGVPSDARVVGMAFADPDPDVLVLTLTSETFPDLEENEAIPCLTPTVEAWTCDELVRHRIQAPILQ